MKFGRNLPRNLVPQWSSEYINYKGLKKLIKSAAEQEKNGQEADLTEFFFTLDRNLETVDLFYNKKYAELARRLRLLYNRYGSNPPTPDSALHGELAEVINALLDLRAQLRMLSYYAELNRRGFVKITKKLDKKLPFACAQQRYLASRVDPRPFASNLQLTNDLNSINAWLSGCEDARFTKDPGSGRSSFSMSRPLLDNLNAFPQELIQAIDECLHEDQRNDIIGSLDKLESTAGIERIIIQRLLLHFLQRAIFSRATACIEELLSRIDSLDEDDDFNKRNCLHRVIISVGRERSSKLNQSNGMPSPDLAPFDSIAPAEAPALELNPYGLEEIDSSRLDSGDDTAQVIAFVLDHLSESQRSALNYCDNFGRMPIHYAAKHGFVNVCEIILERMISWKQIEIFNGMGDIPWLDTDGNSPLHLAVIGGWRRTTEVILNVCTPKNPLDGSRLPLRNWSSSTYLLSIATRANFPGIVRLLCRSGADGNAQNEEGETVIHVAARFGRVECLQAVLDESHNKVSLEIPEYTYGWTPLLTAGVDGQLAVVKTLISAGANPDSLDISGWTAKEHAALRGHFSIAEHLSHFTKPSIPRSPEPRAVANGEVPKFPSLEDRGSSGINRENANGKALSFKSFGHRYLEGESMVLVSLGSLDGRKTVKPIALDNIPLNKAHATQLDTALSVVVSANGATGDSTSIDLPVDENISTEPITFTTKDPSNVKLLFDIVPTYSGSHDQRLGRGVAILSSVRQSIGTKRMNLKGDISVPIVSAKTLDYIGTVNFSFLIVTPFSHPNMSISNAQTYWKSLTAPMVIGHRGLGKNLASRKSLQLGENTIQSFVAAANLGAKYVEFDVQLTKDLVPVIYHDFLVSETGIDAPVHALTLEQFLHVGDSTPRGSRQPSPPAQEPPSTGSWTQADDQHRRYHKQRANSVGGLSDYRSTDISERMKNTRDFKLKGFKGNTRGAFIQERFTTLEEMFNKLPESTGFNIEMKYPMLFESEQEEMDTYAVELNSFVDTVLKMVYERGGNRNIIFSSFHPDICLLLSLKQPSIPVLFLTDAGTSDVGDIRASSLQEAIRFASRWNLLGVVTAAEPLVMCPRLVRVVKESGLVCVSYGVLNNDPKNVKLQVKEGIDAVIVDSVVTVRKGLTSEEDEEESAKKPDNVLVDNTNLSHNLTVEATGA